MRRALSEIYGISLSHPETFCVILLIGLKKLDFMQVFYENVYQFDPYSILYISHITNKKITTKQFPGCERNGCESYTI